MGKIRLVRKKEKRFNSKHTHTQGRVYPHTKVLLQFTGRSVPMHSFLPVITRQERVCPHTEVFQYLILYWKERTYPYTLSCQCYVGIDLSVP